MPPITRAELIEYIQNPFSSWNLEANESKGQQESQAQETGEINGHPRTN